MVSLYGISFVVEFPDVGVTGFWARVSLASPLQTVSLYGVFEFTPETSGSGLVGFSCFSFFYYDKSISYVFELFLLASTLT